MVAGTGSCACDKAERYLREIAARALQNKQNDLPSVDQLATGAGVSRMTMWKAVRKLKEEGLVRAGRGRRLRAGTEQEPSAPPETRTAPWQRLAARIAASVHEGRFPLGRLLGPIKNLQDEYGMGFRSVRRAMEHLAAQGIADRLGKRYRVAAPPVFQTGSARVILVASGAGQYLRFTSPRTEDHLRTLEWECHSAGIRLSRVIAQNLARPGAAAILARELRDSPVIGLLFWTIGVGQSELDRVLPVLLGYRIPLALFNEAYAIQRYRVPPSARVRIYRIADNTGGGIAMARWLLRHRHARVAFLSAQSPEHGHDTLRYEAIRDHFAAAGLPAAAIKLYRCGASIDLGYLRTVRRLRASLPDTVTGVAGSGRGIAAEIRFLCRRYYPQEDIARKYGAFVRMIERVLRESRATAWVADCDSTAVEAASILRDKGITRERRPMILGFDDSAEALQAGLHSVNFGCGDAVRSALRFFLAPSAFAGTPAMIEPDSHVVEREMISLAGRGMSIMFNRSRKQ